MKLTKTQKGYVAVLAVALAAFLADRLFFLPADSGAAGQQQREDPRDLLIRPSGGVAAAVVAPPQRSPYRVDLLAERLQDAAKEQGLKLSGVRDAFVPSAAWVTGPAVVVHDTAGAAAQAFRQKYKLRAIFLGPGGGTAIINDRPLRVGQRVGGFTLVTIDARSAVFAAGGNRVELVLDPVPSSSMSAE